MAATASGGDKVCIQGIWEDGVCICAQGYENDAELSSNLALNPIYCSKQSFVTIVQRQSGPEFSKEILHHAAIALTVACATYCLLAFLSIFTSLAESLYYYFKTGSAGGALDSFKNDNAKYDRQKARSASLWTPPESEYKLVTKDAAELRQKLTITH